MTDALIPVLSFVLGFCVCARVASKHYEAKIARLKER